MNTMNAVARARNLRVSHKDLQELGTFIKGDAADEAKEKLGRVVQKKQPVPYTNHNRDLAHKQGMAAGRYPVNAAEELRKVVHAAQANAEHQGADPDTVKISTVVANKGANRLKPDRQRGRTMKLSHVTVKVTADEALATPQSVEPGQETEQEAEEAAEEEETGTDTDMEAVNPEDVVSGTVNEVKEKLEDFDGDLDTVLEAEQDGKNRETLIQHVEALRDEHAETVAAEEHDYTEIVDNTITDAKELLQDLDNPDYEAALHAEKNNKDRSTFTDWLEGKMGTADSGEDQ